jgi:hypothetical protein
MESVAAERLNKLGKNPSIISTRHDLKRDAAVLKDMINRATPQPSSDEVSQDENNREEEEEHTDTSLTSNENKEIHLNDELINLNKKRKRRRKQRRKSSSPNQNFKKLSRLFLAAPSPTLNSTSNENRTQIRKSPSTPWSLFRKSGSPTPSIHSIHN